MATSAEGRTPALLWVIAILALLWNLFGCYDFMMTEMGNQSYLSHFPADVVAYTLSLPRWTVAAWALGVWGGLAGSWLLMARNRLAIWPFAMSSFGAIVGLGYQMFLTQRPVDMKTGVMAAMPWMIILITLVLLWYAYDSIKRGILR